MRVIRSFPEIIPPGRAYVQDGLERFCMSDYDYTGLKQLGEDLVLLEWDIAVSELDLARFAERASGRDWPMVAPYLSRNSAHYMHWRDPGGICALRPIYRNEPYCDLFGFGMVYFPAWVIRDYPPGCQGSSVLGDGSLPRWLQSLPGARPVPVDWGITVVHLQ